MSCRNGIVVGFLSLAAIFCGNAFPAERPGKPFPVRIGVVSRSTLDMPYYVARDRGFFREEGLEAEIILIRSSLSVQAMLGGSLDFGTATGTAVSAIVNGADVRVVLAMSDKPAFDLIAHPSITKIAELRGKRIGFGGIGGLSELIVRQILAANQIPQDQVKFLPMGQNSLTYASLKAGMIDATMLQIPRKTFLPRMMDFESSPRARTTIASCRAGSRRRKPRRRSVPISSPK